MQSFYDLQVLADHRMHSRRAEAERERLASQHYVHTRSQLVNCRGRFSDALCELRASVDSVPLLHS